MVVLTFWLFALAPALSHAMQGLGGAMPADRASICSSSSGNQGSGPQQPDTAEHLFQHCPLCALHAQDLAPPPAPDAPALRQDLGPSMPERFLSAAADQHAWAARQARAPPAAR